MLGCSGLRSLFAIKLVNLGCVLCSPSRTKHLGQMNTWTTLWHIPSLNGPETGVNRRRRRRRRRRREMNPLNWFWRKRPSGFGHNSTAEQVTEGVDASNLTAIVTGATSGIGKETARVLALRGAKVVIPAITMESGLEAKESILEENPGAKLDVMEMDLSSLKSVESFARSFDSSNQPLNILINNAGIMGCPFSLSKDGIELQFATNHLGHFLLTKLLLDRMKSTAKETGIQGRIVNISSSGHLISDSSWIDLNTINDPQKYGRFNAYCRSKLASILHANELTQRLHEDGANVTANSVHPGMIPTRISSFLQLNYVVETTLTLLTKPFLKSVPQGAATTCYLALHSDLKDVSGKYFVNCSEAKTSSHANDRDLARKLWDFSLELLKNDEQSVKLKDELLPVTSNEVVIRK